MLVCHLFDSQASLIVVKNFEVKKQIVFRHEKQQEKGNTVLFGLMEGCVT